MQLIQFLRDALALLFPELCAGCSQPLVHQEVQLCTYCIYNLPITDFHLDPANLAARQLMSSVPVTAVSSFLYFSSGSIVQKIIHHIKYRNGYAAAEFMGELYGQHLKNSTLHTPLSNTASVELLSSVSLASNPIESLSESSTFSDCQLIIPVPLHKKRLRSRGYNQSDYFAKGLSKALGIEINSNVLVRTAYNESQTKSSSRYDRFENMKGIFRVRNQELLQYKHLLLVDDVLTTGATLSACAGALLSIPGVKVTIATIAFTK